MGTSGALAQRFALYFTRSRYLSSLGLMRILSPWRINGGTVTTTPLESFAGLGELLAVEPRTSGSVSTTSSSIVGGKLDSHRFAFVEVDLYVQAFGHVLGGVAQRVFVQRNLLVVSVFMKWKSVSSLYMNSISWCSRMARSIVSVELKRVSKELPFFRLRRRT